MRGDNGADIESKDQVAPAVFLRHRRGRSGRAGRPHDA
jgi:hypothetical protein